jgi:hypothetical protein
MVLFFFFFSNFNWVQFDNIYMNLTVGCSKHLSTLLVEMVNFLVFFTINYGVDEAFPGAFYRRSRFWPLNWSDSMESELEALCFDSKDEELSVLDSASLGGEVLAGIKGGTVFSCASKSFLNDSPCCSMSS